MPIVTVSLTGRMGLELINNYEKCSSLTQCYTLMLNLMEMGTVTLRVNRPLVQCLTLNTNFLHGRVVIIKSVIYIIVP